MTIDISRRSLLATGTLGLGAFALPGFASAQNILAARGFTHSVASGEPGPDEILLWTRYVPASGDAAELRVELAENADFARPVAGGAQITGAWRDWTAKITVTGLKPGRTYHYRFVAPDGSFSPTGTTKTLPDEGAREFRAAIFSCSNLGFGWFNAYGHAAARDDLDLWIHLGDYFYEYGADYYPSPAEAVPGRAPQPSGELIHLADYRLRYASYRADPDLRALHARLPMIAQWDDHESANDSWEGGAENHHPAKEGEWNDRRAAAIQAYREWMPVSDEPWKTYDIGTLATLYRTESRLLARTRQRQVDEFIRASDPVAALTAFRDRDWQDPAATMLGSQQEAWLAHGLRASVKAGKRWQVVGFGTVMGELRSPLEAASWVAPGDAGTAAYVKTVIAAAKLGMPSNYDSWDGYPAARRRFLDSVRAAEANLIVISGDSHNGWAFDLAQDRAAVGVEFAGHAVTSPGYETAFAAAPATVARGLVAANPQLKWCDTSKRGYMALTITPDHARNDWMFVDSIRTRSPKASIGHSATVLRGRARMEA